MDVADLAQRAADALATGKPLTVTPEEFAAIKKAAPDAEYDYHLRVLGVNPSWAGIPIIVLREGES